MVAPKTRRGRNQIPPATYSSVASHTIRAAAWLASSAKWTVLKWTSNAARNKASFCPLAIAMMSNSASEHAEHLPRRPSPLSPLEITRCGFFMRSSFPQAATDYYGNELPPVVRTNVLMGSRAPTSHPPMCRSPAYSPSAAPTVTPSTPAYGKHPSSRNVCIGRDATALHGHT
jgi:hypothetical protein